MVVARTTRYPGAGGRGKALSLVLLMLISSLSLMLAGPVAPVAADDAAPGGADAGDDQQNATRVTNFAVLFNGTVGVQGDFADWYSVTAFPGDTVNYSVACAGQCSLSASIHDDQGRRVGNATTLSSTPHHFLWTAPASTPSSGVPLYLQVSTAAPTGDYQFQVNVTAPSSGGDGEPEPRPWTKLSGLVRADGSSLRDGDRLQVAFEVHDAPQGALPEVRLRLRHVASDVVIGDSTAQERVGSVNFGPVCPGPYLLSASLRIGEETVEQWNELVHVGGDVVVGGSSTLACAEHDDAGHEGEDVPTLAGLGAWTVRAPGSPNSSVAPGGTLIWPTEGYLSGSSGDTEDRYTATVQPGGRFKIEIGSCPTASANVESVTIVDPTDDSVLATSRLNGSTGACSVEYTAPANASAPIPVHLRVLANASLTTDVAYVMSGSLTVPSSPPSMVRIANEWITETVQGKEWKRVRVTGIDTANATSNVTYRAQGSQTTQSFPVRWDPGEYSPSSSVAVLDGGGLPPGVYTATLLVEDAVGISLQGSFTVSVGHPLRNASLDACENHEQCRVRPLDHKIEVGEWNYSSSARNSTTSQTADVEVRGWSMGRSSVDGASGGVGAEHTTVFSIWTNNTEPWAVSAPVTWTDDDRGASPVHAAVEDFVLSGDFPEVFQIVMHDHVNGSEERRAGWDGVYRPPIRTNASLGLRLPAFTGDGVCNATVSVAYTDVNFNPLATAGTVDVASLMQQAETAGHVATFETTLQAGSTDYTDHDLSRNTRAPDGNGTSQAGAVFIFARCGPPGGGAGGSGGAVYWGMVGGFTDPTAVSVAADETFRADVQLWPHGVDGFEAWLSSVVRSPVMASSVAHVDTEIVSMELVSRLIAPTPDFYRMIDRAFGDGDDNLTEEEWETFNRTAGGDYNSSRSNKTHTPIVDTDGDGSNDTLVCESTISPSVHVRLAPGTNGNGSECMWDYRVRAPGDAHYGSISQNAASGNFTVDSFFDIFTEVSVLGDPTASTSVDVLAPSSRRHNGTTGTWDTEILSMDLRMLVDPDGVVPTVRFGNESTATVAHELAHVKQVRYSSGQDETHTPFPNSSGRYVFPALSAAGTANVRSSCNSLDNDCDGVGFSNDVRQEVQANKHRVASVHLTPATTLSSPVCRLDQQTDALTAEWSEVTASSVLDLSSGDVLLRSVCSNPDGAMTRSVVVADFDGDGTPEVVYHLDDDDDGDTIPTEDDSTSGRASNWTMSVRVNRIEMAIVAPGGGGGGGGVVVTTEFVVRQEFGQQAGSRASLAVRTTNGVNASTTPVVDVTLRATNGSGNGTGIQFLECFLTSSAGPAGGSTGVVEAAIAFDVAGHGHVTVLKARDDSPGSTTDGHVTVLKIASGGGDVTDFSVRCAGGALAAAADDNSTFQIDSFFDVWTEVSVSDDGSPVLYGNFSLAHAVRTGPVVLNIVAPNGTTLQTLRVSTNPLHTDDLGDSCNPLYTDERSSGGGGSISARAARAGNRSWSVDLSDVSKLYASGVDVSSLVSRLVMRCDLVDRDGAPVTIEIELPDGTIINGSGDVDISSLPWTQGAPTFPSSVTVRILSHDDTGPVVLFEGDVAITGTLSISGLPGTDGGDGGVDGEGNGTEGGFVPGFDLVMVAAAVGLAVIAMLVAETRRRDE